MPIRSPTCPRTVSQDRTLTNYRRQSGSRVYAPGNHNVKLGGTISATKLQENFTFGITDPTRSGVRRRKRHLQSEARALRLDAAGRRAARLRPVVHRQAAGVYVQDDIKARRRDVQARRAGRSLRRADDRDAGAAASRRVVRRAGDRHGAARLVRPHARDALQREPAAVGRLRLERPVRHERPPAARQAARVRGRRAAELRPVARGRLWATSTSAPTTATTSACSSTRRSSFPISWDHSHVYGLTGRVNLLEHRGFSAFFVMATTNAIFSPPGTGGMLLEQAAGDFRIDHDQKFNATTNVQYVFSKRARRVGRALVAVRLGPGRGGGRQPRGCAGADRRSAGGDRVLLREPVRDARQPADERRLHDVAITGRPGCGSRPKGRRTT